METRVSGLAGAPRRPSPLRRTTQNILYIVRSQPRATSTVRPRKRPRGEKRSAAVYLEGKERWPPCIDRGESSEDLSVVFRSRERWRAYVSALTYIRVFVEINLRTWGAFSATAVRVVLFTAAGESRTATVSHSQTTGVMCIMHFVALLLSAFFFFFFWAERDKLSRDAGGLEPGAGRPQQLSTEEDNLPEARRVRVERGVRWWAGPGRAGREGAGRAFLSAYLSQHLQPACFGGRLAVAPFLVARVFFRRWLLLRMHACSSPLTRVRAGGEDFCFRYFRPKRKHKYSMYGEGGRLG